MKPKQMSCVLLLAVALLVVTGCGGPPKRALPRIDVDLPDGWTAAAPDSADVLSPPAGERDETEWWNEFDDPLLHDVIREALENNSTLAVAEGRVDQAAAEARIAGADLYPQINAGVDGSRRRNNLIGIPIPGFNDVITVYSNSFGASLESLWEIDLWGRVRSAKSAAGASFQASRADLAAARLSVAAQCAKVWYAVREATLQADLAEETVESFRHSVERLRRRYESGLVTSLDLRRSESNLASAEALLESRRVQLDSAKRQLEILLGRYPAGTIESAGDLPVPRGAVPAMLPADLLTRRPDLAAAERRFAAAGKSHGEAKRSLLPRISLTGSGGTLSEEVGDLLDGNFQVWSIAAGIVQPIFQGGRLMANVSRTAALEDQALAGYVNAALVAFGEVESSLFADRALAREEERIGAAADEAEASSRLAESQYDAGLIELPAFLEAERSALKARGDLAAVRRARLDARINLHVALGGGFDMNENSDTFLEVSSESE